MLSIDRALYVLTMNDSIQLLDFYYLQSKGDSIGIFDNKHYSKLCNLSKSSFNKKLKDKYRVVPISEAFIKQYIIVNNGNELKPFHVANAECWLNYEYCDQFVRKNCNYTIAMYILNKIYNNDQYAKLRCFNEIYDPFIKEYNEKSNINNLFRSMKRVLSNINRYQMASLIHGFRYSMMHLCDANIEHVLSELPVILSELYAETHRKPKGFNLLANKHYIAPDNIDVSIDILTDYILFSKQEMLIYKHPDNMKAIITAANRAKNKTQKKRVFRYMTNYMDDEKQSIVHFIDILQKLDPDKKDMYRLELLEKKFQKFAEIRDQQMANFEFAFN